MSKTDKEALMAKMERVFQEWAALNGAEENSAAALSKRNELFVLVYGLFPGREDEINTLFLTGEWQKCDPAKGSARGFFASRLRLREKDEYRREQLRSQRMVWDAPAEEDGPGILDALPAGPGSAPEQRLRVDASVCEMISAMLELPRRLHGRANNDTRRNYFRMFFAETVVSCIHGADALESFRRRERDLFAAMKLEFLDFFMTEPCRRVDAIADSGLKPYGELVEGRGPEETKLPLPGDVYISYLGRVENTRVGPPVISEQRKA